MLCMKTATVAWLLLQQKMQGWVDVSLKVASGGMRVESGKIPSLSKD
jgi:hypothetical protein